MDIFTEINGAGLKFSVHGDRLKVENAECLTDRLRSLIRNNKQTLINHLSRTHAAQVNELQMNIREAIEERAAIMEHDGGLSRQDAEQEAIKCIRVYTYRHAEKPDVDLTVIMQNTNLQEAEISLRRRFGDDLISVLREYSAWRVAEMDREAQK